MDFLELARERKSVRGFTSRPLEAEKIVKILEAALEAPSGGNLQPWHFYAVTDRKVIRALNEKAYGAEWFGTAAAVFVVCAEPGRSAKYGERGKTLYCLQDTGAAIQNMLLCARSLGADTCWCGSIDEAAVSETLSIPAGRRPVAMIAAGYGAAERKKPARRPFDEAITFVGGAAPEKESPPPQKNIRISGCSMAGAEFDDVNLADSSFVNINMQNASFTDINMTGASFGAVCLNGAEFGCVEMKNARFKNPDLVGACFENCGLAGLKIENCDLSGTKISASVLSGLEIDGVCVEELLKKYKEGLAGGNAPEQP